jgi:hypothetical protein
LDVERWTFDVCFGASVTVDTSRSGRLLAKPLSEARDRLGPTCGVLPEREVIPRDCDDLR